eukprot:767710-Hanusia_phi.AAC.1
MFGGPRPQQEAELTRLRYPMKEACNAQQLLAALVSNGFSLLRLVMGQGERAVLELAGLTSLRNSVAEGMESEEDQLERAQPGCRLAGHVRGGPV